MRLSEHCHALLGFAYLPPWSVNAGFVRGCQRTLIVDAGPTAQAAETVIGYAEAAAPSNALLAVDTERHLDHMAGNERLLSRGLEVWGHPDVQRCQEEFETDVAEYCASVGDSRRRQDGEGRLPFLGTRIVNPNRAVEGEMEFDLGGLVARVLPAPGHTPANLLVWVEADGVVFSGDTVVSDYRPNLESGGPQDWQLWLRALERIEALSSRVLVPGHGRVLRDEEIGIEVARVRRHLERALAG